MTVAESTNSGGAPTPTENGKNGDERVWNIRVKAVLDDKVDTAAAANASTKSDFIRQAVREKLEKMGVTLTVDGDA